MKVKEEERLRKAEERYIAAEKRRKKRVIISAIIFICIAFVTVLSLFIVSNSKYNKALKLYNSGKYNEAIIAFEKLNSYKDSTDKLKQCKYLYAVDLEGSGNIVEAYETLIALGGYEDSADRASEIYEKYKNEKLKVAKAGDYIFFGTYEQDNDTANGKEYIEWLVLEVKNGKALVISKYALDCQQYNTSCTDVTWEICSLRKWLNGTFINNAFSAEEQAMIPTVTVSADKNPDYSTDPGNATQDKVFLLSITEANRYFTSDKARKCVPTDYAIVQGAYTSDSYKAGGRDTCWWWLRSPGYDQNFCAANVFCDGYVQRNSVEYECIAVRPALWINLES